MPTFSPQRALTNQVDRLETKDTTNRDKARNESEDEVDRYEARPKPQRRTTTNRRAPRMNTRITRSNDNLLRITIFQRTTTSPCVCYPPRITLSRGQSDSTDVRCSRLTLWSKLAPE